MPCSVWMPLDEEERRTAKPIVTNRLALGGVLIIHQRQGPVPRGRYMFEVAADKTIRLVEGKELKTVQRIEDKADQLAEYQTQVSFRR